MTRNDRAARGHPLAAFFAALLMVSLLAVAASGIPHVRVEQIADPTEIYIYGQEAAPDVATLKLFVEGLSLDDGVPIDCVFIVDVSATATGGLGEAATLALDLLPLFDEGDRVGLVSFSDRAWLDVGLTDDTSRVMRAIADLETGGKSALGEGLRLGRQELLDWGRDDARLIEIVLSDGQSNIGRTPEVEGDVASEAGIVLIPIGVGTIINRHLLEDLAEQTGGIFIERVTETTVQDVDAILSATPGPMMVRVEKVLPPEFTYMNATPNPKSIAGTSEGTVLVWEFELAPMWSASIEISSGEAGSWLTDVDSVVTVTDDRERASTYAVPARTISVLEPLPPTAFFYLDPTQPQVGVEAKLDASGSVVYQDGEIELYAWDLDGDGIVDLSGDDATITHMFPDEGEFEIALTVYDSAGRSGSFERTVEILPSVSVTRTIETCLPDDETIENARIEVIVEIYANTTIHGLTLREELPAGWAIELGENSHATARKDDAAAVIDWLFLETLHAGDYRLITYTVTAPAGNFASEIEEGQPGARDQVTINGQIASSSPRLSEAVLGEDKIVRLQYLSVPVAITHWDSVAGNVEVCLPGEIAFDQIQYAVSLWVSGDTVPSTNEAIDLSMIRDLIAYWLTDTSVYEPLPE